jgi:hypothetical protein
VVEADEVVVVHRHGSDYHETRVPVEDLTRSEPEPETTDKT